MGKNKFTIIIPTRERANTLYYCLQTCIAQDYDNFEILVSDNFSNDNTKEVVESFTDHRIRYINTGKRLSMSKNWEFALSHVTEGWVGFIGDDDGLLPGSVSFANELLESIDKENDVIYWYDKTPWYFWAEEFGGSGRDNEMFLNVIKDYSPFNAIDRLLKLAAFKGGYESYPIIYHGFSSVELVKRIKEHSKHSLFFQSSIPDVYSAIAMSVFSKNVLVSPIPLSINGVSKNSTGGASLFKKEEVSINKFISEPNIPFNPAISFDNSPAIMANLNILISDCFLQFLDNVDSPLNEQKKEIKEYVLLQLIKYLEKNDTDKELAGKLILHNGLQNTSLQNNVIYKDQAARKKYFFYKYSYKIDCSKYGTKTIADVAGLYKKIVAKGIVGTLKHKAGRSFKVVKRYIRFLLNT